jgi:hypothetical protein
MANPPLEGDSTTNTIPGVKGTYTHSGFPLVGTGVWGECQMGNGVYGLSHGANSTGVWGESDGPSTTVWAPPGFGGGGTTPGVTYGVVGRGGAGVGVLGVSSGANAAVVGYATSSSGSGVAGVYGVSSNGNGVHGSTGNSNMSGVNGENTGGGNGVYGSSISGNAVYGTSNSGIGIVGVSQSADAINGTSASLQHAGVSANNTGGGYGLWAKAKIAGYFDGDIQVLGSATVTGNHSVNGNVTVTGNETVTGNVTVTGNETVTGNAIVTGTVTAKDVALSGADCAEEFDVAFSSKIDVGTVMVLGKDGVLLPSASAYDKKVVGVISGAGDFKPGLILDRHECSQGRLPLALIGKVFCKVDATHGPIEVGDLLTTSPTAGHAMKARDPLKAFGSVIGKALRPLPAGCGLIPILVTMQ